MTLRLMKRRSWMPRGTGLSHGNSTRSRPDMTALTPGSARAFSKLIDLMRACGWGLRRILPHNMPGLEKSAPKVARPVTLSSPSGLLVRLPIHLLFEPFAVIAALSLPFRLAPAADCRRGSPTLPRCHYLDAIASMSLPRWHHFDGITSMASLRWHHFEP